MTNSCAYRHNRPGAHHFGNNRLVTDASGTILQTNHYDPYGESLPAGASVDSDNPYKWGNKEYDVFLGSYDFGARYYTPASTTIPRWTTMDPLCEKYYSISPYAYCAGNPVNMVDPEGSNWYSYTTPDTNEIRYKYVEGQLSEEEIKEGGYTDLGYCFWRDNKYYSLFGNILDRDVGGFPVGELYSSIDRLIINYVNYYKECLNPENEEVRNTTTDYSSIKYKNAFSFVYSGVSFSSIQDGTRFYPLSHREFRGMSIDGDPLLMMRVFPTMGNMPMGGLTLNTVDKQWPDGYWLTAESHSAHSIPLQIRFDKTNAAAFINAINKLFGTSFSL